MPPLLGKLIGLTGLLGAAYLFLHQGSGTTPGLGKPVNCDAILFGIAIIVLSVGVLLTSGARHEPDAGDSLRM